MLTKTEGTGERESREKSCTEGRKRKDAKAIQQRKDCLTENPGLLHQEDYLRLPPSKQRALTDLRKTTDSETFIT